MPGHQFLAVRVQQRGVLGGEFRGRNGHGEIHINRMGGNPFAPDEVRENEKQFLRTPHGKGREDDVPVRISLAEMAKVRTVTGF